MTTSPLHNNMSATPISLHSVSTALSNASGDDLRHRAYEDFESDDDLRREDIFLLTDAGKGYKGVRIDYFKKRLKLALSKFHLQTTIHASRPITKPRS